QRTGRWRALYPDASGCPELNLPPIDGQISPLRRPDIELPWTADLFLGIGDHLIPLRDPANGARDSEQGGEHVGGKTDRVQDHARVEIDVGVQLLVDEVGSVG